MSSHPLTIGLFRFVGVDEFVTSRPAVVAGSDADAHLLAVDVED
jgi:hypothetical protein